MKKLLLYIKCFLRCILKPFSFIPAILVMYMIFSFSTQPGEVSAGLSYKVSHKIVTVSEQILDHPLTVERENYYTDLIHPYVRKLAHVSEYFLLAVTVALPFYVYGLRGILLVIVCGLICVAYAGLDEYHQSFVADRGPSVRDVLIDSIGIFPGIICVRVFGWIFRKTLFRPLAIKENDF